MDRMIATFVADPELFSAVVEGVRDAIADLDKPEPDQLAAIVKVKALLAA